MVAGRSTGELHSDIGLMALALSFERAGLEVPPEARDHARAQAEALVAQGDVNPAAESLANLIFVSALFAAAAPTLAGNGPAVLELVNKIEESAQLPRLLLGRAVLGMPELLFLRPAAAIDAELTLLWAFTGADAVSLWILQNGGELRHVGHAGDFAPAEAENRRVASRLLAACSGGAWRERGVAGLAIELQNRPAAALLTKTSTDTTDDQLALLEASVPILRAALERDHMPVDAGYDEHAVVAASERRLARLRFDLHDGPQQNLMLLAEDLRLFGSQLATVLGPSRTRERLLGRLDDLQAQLVALDGDLRRIAHSLESPFLVPEPLPRALAQLAEAFAARTGIKPDMRLHSDLSGLTDSQQITLLGLITEALANIREHSQADRVWVTVSVDDDGVHATVTDNGRGFDPEETLIRAAREGHLGLVGMHERVRLLGGQTQIESRPGGPTEIAVTLPVGPAPAPDPG